MPENIDKQIEALRKGGYSNDEIAEYYRSQLKDNYTPEQINTWLSEKKLIGTITQQTVGKRLSEAFSGFGRDVLSGAAATKALTAKGTGPLGQALSVGTSYLGGGGGQMVEDLIRGESPPMTVEGVTEAFKRFHRAGTTAAQYDLLGGPIGEVAGKVAAPFARKMSTEDILAKQFAQRERLPVAPSAIRPTRTAKMFEWTGERLAGNLITDMRRRQLAEGFERIVKEADESLPFKTDKIEAGMRLGAGVKEAKSDIARRTRQAYDSFLDRLRTDFGGGKQLSLENFSQVAEKYREQAKEGSELRQFLAQIADRKGQFSVEEMDNFQKQIWNRTWPKKGHIGGQLWDALDKDLAAEGAEYAALLKSAKDTAKLAHEFKKDPTLRVILRQYGNDPERVILNAFRAGNFQSVNRIKQLVDRETWETARSQFVKNILDTGYNQEREFVPAKFLNNYRKYEKQIRNVMPETADRLDMLAIIIERSLTDLRPTSRIGAVGDLALAGAMGTGAALSSPALAVPFGFTAILAYSMRNPKGWMKKWLTTGFLPSKQMLRLSPRFLPKYEPHRKDKER